MTFVELNLEFRQYILQITTETATQAAPFWLFSRLLRVFPLTVIAPPRALDCVFTINLNVIF